MKKMIREPNHPWFNESLEKLCKKEGEIYHEARKNYRKKKEEGEKAPKFSRLSKTRKQWEKLYGEELEKLKKFSQDVDDPKMYWKEGSPLNFHETLTPFLRKITQRHCSYCDSLVGVEGTSEESIEHFKPKTFPQKEENKKYEEYEKLAYQWENLFLSCVWCQRWKSNNFIENVLKPDSPEYDFGIYFEIDIHNGVIKPNPLLNPEEEKRASDTIDFLGLNRDALPGARMKEWRRYYSHGLNSGDEEPLHLYSYRFFIEERLYREKEEMEQFQSEESAGQKKK